MDDDPILRVFLVASLVVFSLVAWQPALSIKLLSYGRAELADVNPVVLRVTRIIAGVVAVCTAVYILWSLLRG